MVQQHGCPCSLGRDPVSAVIPPDPSPWSSSAGPWSTESSLPAVFSQYEEQDYSTFTPSNEAQSQTVQV